jgi:pimeloyl-ACP methyl ester carboxylesterase
MPAIAAMQSPASDLYLETNGARLRYRDEGHGCAVLLVHGWTLDLDQWEPQAAALSGRFRVIRLDRRGFGLSSGLPSIAADVNDLSALCRHLQLQSVALVGMSQGAQPVSQFAKSHPRITSCVVLDGPPDLGTAGSQSSADDVPYRHYRELAQHQGLPAFRREWSQHALTRLRTTEPRAHALLARMIARYPGRDLLDIAGRPDTSPSAGGFESAGPPILVLNGEFDLESRKSFARRIALQSLRIEHVEIAEAGHLCNLDNPGAYNGELERFFERKVWS